MLELLPEPASLERQPHPLRVAVPLKARVEPKSPLELLVGRPLPQLTAHEPVARA